jgi:hypothetical protein
MILMYHLLRMLNSLTNYRQHLKLKLKVNFFT